MNGALKQNLTLVKEALTALISSKNDHEAFMFDMPDAIIEACESRREQAQRFLTNLIDIEIEDKTRLSLAEA